MYSNISSESWLINSFTICVGVLVAIVLLSYFSRWRMSWNYKRLPPGPFCWPLLGYLPFYNRQTSYIKLMEETKKYGTIFRIYLCSQYAVVIDDFEILKVAYNKEEFLNRPSKFFNNDPDHKQEMIFMENGAAWKEQLKFAMNFYRHLGTGTDYFSSIVMTEVAEVISTLENNQNNDLNVVSQVEHALNNVAFHMLYGKKFDQDHRIVKFNEVLVKAANTYFLLKTLKVFLPWMGFIVNLLPNYLKIVKVMRQMDKFIKNEILEHMSDKELNDRPHFMGLYLQQMDKPGLQERYNMHSLLGNIKIQFSASTETTRTTIVWFLLLMAEHPEIQKAIQKQIDSELGREREPAVADKVKLPLLEAAILEAMRFRNFSHIAGLRIALEDITLCGYDIPKGTYIMLNKTSHFRNPKYWTEPDRFNPNRFLTHDGTKIKVPEYFIPFSYGRRTCPGDKIGISILFLFATSILQRFTVLPPTGGVNLKIKVNVFNESEHPFARFQCRA